MNHERFKKKPVNLGYLNSKRLGDNLIRNYCCTGEKQMEQMDGMSSSQG